MSSARSKESKPAVDAFDEELDTRKKKKYKVEAWFEAHPEILAKVHARLKRASEDVNSASATEIYHALKKHFKAPFADYTFRRWVHENYEGFEFRTRGASRS